MECVVYSGHAKSDCYSPAEKTKLRCHDYQFTPGHHGAPEADGLAGRMLRFALFFPGGWGSSGWVGVRESQETSVHLDSKFRTGQLRINSIPDSSGSEFMGPPRIPPKPCQIILDPMSVWWIRSLYCIHIPYLVNSIVLSVLYCIHIPYLVVVHHEKNWKRFFHLEKIPKPTQALT